MRTVPWHSLIMAACFPAGQRTRGSRSEEDRGPVLGHFPSTLGTQVILGYIVHYNAPTIILSLPPLFRRPCLHEQLASAILT